MCGLIKRLLGMIGVGSMFVILGGSVSVWGELSSLPELTELSIEELSHIEVISASKTPLRQSHSPAAIYVLTSDDIRRSGVTSIPEALRLVPGIQVARISSSKWAVSSRGFNMRYSNKLLVLMDGRVLYLPLFSGVFWECQDYPLEDIDRIEVVRGPGASLWGANAVNGVINIITKHSGDTTGGLAVAGAGDYEKGFARARLGDALGDKGFARVYASYYDRDEMVNAYDQGSGDAWNKFQTGFRSDVALGDHADLTVQGDYYSGDLDERHIVPSLEGPDYFNMFDAANSIEGYNALSRLSVKRYTGDELALQVYGDSMTKVEAGVDINTDTLDLDFQYVMAPWRNHDLIWGVGFRYYRDSIDYNDGKNFFDPGDSDDMLYSSFIQDTIHLSDSFDFIWGARFEHNDYTGYEIQPNARFLWTLSESRVLWGAVCRAVRTPSRGETSIRFTQSILPPMTGPNTSPYPMANIIRGGDDAESEDLMAFELGHRINSGKDFSLDTAAFYYVYDDLGYYSFGGSEYVLDETPQHIDTYLYTGYGQEARTWGIELSANWQPIDFMRLKATYSFIEMHFDLNGPQETTFSPYSEEDTPAHQATLSSFIDLPRKTECDVSLRYVDELEHGFVDAYTELDVRLGWRPNKHVELSVSGKNLLHDKHSEILGSYILSQSTEIVRSIYGKITLRY